MQKHLVSETTILILQSMPRGLLVGCLLPQVKKKSLVPSFNVMIFSAVLSSTMLKSGSVELNSTSNNYHSLFPKIQSNPNGSNKVRPTLFPTEYSFSLHNVKLTVQQIQHK